MTSTDGPTPERQGAAVDTDHCNAADQIIQFVTAIYDETDIIEERLLQAGKPAKRKWHSSRDIATNARRLVLENSRGRNIYLGASPRKHVGGAEADDVSLARCLFADFDPANFGLSDDEHVDIDACHERCLAAGLPLPTIIVDTGHGYQFWWRLTEPITDLADWTALQKLLIRAVDSDDSIHDPPRIMRVPGFNNTKREPFVPAFVVESDPKRQYPVEHLRAVLDRFVDSPKANVIAAPASPNGHAPNGMSVLARAMSYAAKVPTMNEGEGRNKKAFVLSAAMVKDFDLSDSDAWPIVDRWNMGNNPPLSNEELRDAFASARKNGKHSTGALLADARQVAAAAVSKKATARAKVIEAYQRFPIEALPELARSLVDEAGRALGCDASFIGLPLLAAFAATVGTTRRIKLKRTWCEPCILWCGVVAESGQLKTPAHALALKPIWSRQQRACAIMRRRRINTSAIFSTTKPILQSGKRAAVRTTCPRRRSRTSPRWCDSS